MKKNTKKTLIGIFIVVVSISIFSFVFVRSFIYSPVEEVPLAQELKPQQVIIERVSPMQQPEKLIIPSLKVDTKVQDVGITKSGNMATPTNFTDVGWYKYGTVPGQEGNAVIAGHVDNGVAFPGVFKHLEKLKKGDDIYIKTKDNTEIHFKVTGFKTYDFNAKADDVFISQNNTRALKLITCTGTFVKKYGTHDKRLVVTAEMVNS